MNRHIDSPGVTLQPLATAVVPNGPRMNAVKHGLRSQSVLLPGDDLEEFCAMRQGMFDLYKPRTPNEAQCVETMAAHEWSMGRCRLIRTHYQGRLIALLEGMDTAHCERDPHRWHHSAMDCSLDEKRIAKLQDHELKKLVAMQKLRRQNLMAEAAEREQVVAPREVAMPPGEVAEPGNAVLPGGDARPTHSEPQEAVAATAEQPATASDDGENGKNSKRTGNVERVGRFAEAPAPTWARAVDLPPNFIRIDAVRGGYMGVSSMEGWAVNGTPSP